MKPGDWLEVRIHGSQEALEGVANFAFELGATGAEETAEGIRLFFRPGAPCGQIQASLAGYVRSLREMGCAAGDPIPHAFPEEDWGRNWRDSFKPVRIGSRLVVKPPWEPWSEAKGGIVIDVSPKMSFGTGSHETTRLCLEMLERFVRPGMAVFDVGTGSGILAIAALKLGAASAHAVDVEKESVENTRENAELNRVADRIEVRLGSLDAWPAQQYDLILANIDRKTLVSMIPGFREYGGSGSLLILSGILTEEVDRIIDSLAAARFRPVETRTLGEWAGFAAAFD